jgi:hypothetical protein
LPSAGGAPWGAPGPRRCCRSETRQEPTRTQATLATSPFRGDLAQNGAHPRPPGPPRREQKPGTSCSGRLPRYRGDCGWIECPNQLVGWDQPPGSAKKAPRGAVVFCSHACTFLRLGGRETGKLRSGRLWGRRLPAPLPSPCPGLRRAVPSARQPADERRARDRTPPPEAVETGAVRMSHEFSRRPSLLPCPGAPAWQRCGPGAAAVSVADHGRWPTLARGWCQYHKRELTPAP